MEIEDIVAEKSLDEEFINYLQRKLHEKGINIETQDEVIKYVWANKKLFGHILDIKKLADQCIENLDRSIVFFGTDTTNLPTLYKSKFNIITSILSMMIVGGYYQPYSKEVYLNPLVTGKATKRRKQDKDSIFMHEMDHCATTTYVELNEEQKEAFIKYKSNKLMKTLQKISPSRITKYLQKKWENMTGGKVAIIGINDPIVEMQYNLPLSRLNEGITVIKQKMYSDILGLSFNQTTSSSYLAEPFVAEFVARKIGINNLIKMHQNNDYEGIRNQFNIVTGQDLNNLVRDLNKLPILVPIPKSILKQKLKLNQYEKKQPIVSRVDVSEIKIPSMSNINATQQKDGPTK